MALATITTIADIVGDNAKHQLTGTAKPVRAVILGAVGGAIRVGDTNVSSSRGASIPSGTAITIPALFQWSSDAYTSPALDLSTVYAFVPNSATLTITVIS